MHRCIAPLLRCARQQACGPLAGDGRLLAHILRNAHPRRPFPQRSFLSTLSTETETNSDLESPEDQLATELRGRENFDNPMEGGANLLPEEMALGDNSHLAEDILEGRAEQQLRFLASKKFKKYQKNAKRNAAEQSLKIWDLMGDRNMHCGMDVLSDVLATCEYTNSAIIKQALTIWESREYTAQDLTPKLVQSLLHFYSLQGHVHFLHAYSRYKDPERSNALTLLKHIGERDMSLSENSYNSQLILLAKLHKIEKAEHQIEFMKEKGIRKLDVCDDHLIVACLFETKLLRNRNTRLGKTNNAPKKDGKGGGKTPIRIRRLEKAMQFFRQQHQGVTSTTHPPLPINRSHLTNNLLMCLLETRYMYGRKSEAGRANRMKRWLDEAVFVLEKTSFCPKDPELIHELLEYANEAKDYDAAKFIWEDYQKKLRAQAEDKRKYILAKKKKKAVAAAKAAAERGDGGDVEVVEEVEDHIEQEEAEGEAEFPPIVIEALFDPDNVEEGFSRVENASQALGRDSIVRLGQKFTSVEQLDKAYDYLLQRNKRGEAVGAVSLNVLTQACAELEEMDAVFQTFDDYPAFGVEPTVDSYRALLQACATAYPSDEVVHASTQVFTQMKKAGIQPDGACYSHVIDSCRKRSWLQRAVEYLTEAKEQDIQIDRDTAFKLAGKYAMRGKLEEALQVKELHKESGAPDFPEHSVKFLRRKSGEYHKERGTKPSKTKKEETPSVDDDAKEEVEGADEEAAASPGAEEGESVLTEAEESEAATAASEEVEVIDAAPAEAEDAEVGSEAVDEDESKENEIPLP